MVKRTIRNGINVEQLSKLIAAVKADPEMGKLRVQAHAQWQGGGRCVIRLSPPGHNGDREKLPFSIEADSLSSLVTDGGTPNAGELLLAALASDLVAGFVRHASQRGIHLESLNVETHGVVDLGHQLGLSEGAAENVGRVYVHLSVDADCPNEQLCSLWGEAQRTSPMVAVLGRSAELFFGLMPIRGEAVGDRDPRT